MRCQALSGVLLLFLFSPSIHAVESGYCSEPGIAIPEGTVEGVSDILSIESPGMLVSDLDVLVEITHPLVGELSITLENAERSILLYDPFYGQCWNPDMAVIFDDEAPGPPSCEIISPAVAGLAIPFQELAAFDGDLLHGDWTLNITDMSPSATGTLLRWCLTASTVANSLPTANFRVDCEGLSCQFTDESFDDDGSVVSWDWDFGDGGGSNEQNPLHPFADYQVYTVTLAVTDNHGGVGFISRQVDVPEFPPVASFDVSCRGQTCDFTDTSTDPDGTVVSWEWTFGFGDAFSTTQNPQMVFPGGGTYDIWLQVTDNDGYTDAITESVIVEPNTPPTADSQSVQTLEDTEIIITLTGSDDDDDPISFSVTDGPFNGTITERDPEPGLAALVGSWPTTYRPGPDYVGPDEFQFVASDYTDSSEPATVTIDVIPVNDPPRFQPGPSPVWPHATSGEKSHTGWATDIAPGPGDTEDGQNLVFSVELIDPDGVIVHPEAKAGSVGVNGVSPVIILPDGTLQYALSGNSGIADISITLSDDGGTGNGGIDTSDPRYSTIEVMHDGSSLPGASYAWSMQLPELYNPAETCCFDYTGDGVADNAYGSMAALMAGLAADANEVMAELISTGIVTKLLFWKDLPAFGVPGSFTLEFGNGRWSGPATFTDRVAGMEDFIFDSNGLDGEPPNVQDCVVDSSGDLSCTGDALTLPLAVLGVQQNLAGTTLHDVRIEGSYSSSRNDCAGNCSVDDTAAVPPLVRGGFRIGAYMPLDEFFSALNESYQSCVCFGDGNVQLFEYGEGQSEYEFACTPEGEQAADCSACQDLSLDTVCSLGGLLIPNFADVDSNDNGIEDALSVGLRMAVSGANIVGCSGTNCVPKPDEMFENGFEGQ